MAAGAGLAKTARISQLITQRLSRRNGLSRPTEIQRFFFLFCRRKHATDSTPARRGFAVASRPRVSRNRSGQP